MEQQATNTGENIAFGYELLAKKEIICRVASPNSKAYIERCVYVSFLKQWKGDVSKVAMSPPDYNLLREYISEDHVVNIMVGDLQKIIEYPKLGSQIYQNMSKIVLAVYDFW